MFIRASAIASHGSKHLKTGLKEIDVSATFDASKDLPKEVVAMLRTIQSRMVSLRIASQISSPRMVMIVTIAAISAQWNI